MTIYDTGLYILTLTALLPLFIFKQILLIIILRVSVCGIYTVHISWFVDLSSTRSVVGLVGGKTKE